MGHRSYSYVFSPDWEEWRKAGEPHIAGLPMDEVVLKDYIFYEYLPAFYYTRYIPPQRVDWDYYARRKGIDPDKEHDPWEMMIAYQGRCMEDQFLVEKCEINYELYGIESGK